MKPQSHSPLSWAAGRLIFGLLSVIGILIGLQYNSIRDESVATAADLASLRHRIAQVEASQLVAEERSRRAEESFIEIQRRLGAIDARLVDIGEQVAVLSDRAARPVLSPDPGWGRKRPRSPDVSPSFP